MKIEYEIGDKVYVEDYGGETGEIIAIRKNGYTVRDRYGQTWFIGKRQIEPHPSTVSKAKHIAQAR
jgi:predicted nucleotidyltransferase